MAGSLVEPVENQGSHPQAVPGKLEPIAREIGRGFLGRQTHGHHDRISRRMGERPHPDVADLGKAGVTGPSQPKIARVRPVVIERRAVEKATLAQTVERRLSQKRPRLEIVTSLETTVAGRRPADQIDLETTVAQRRRAEIEDDAPPGVVLVERHGTRLDEPGVRREHALGNLVATGRDHLETLAGETLRQDATVECQTDPARLCDLDGALVTSGAGRSGRRNEHEHNTQQNAGGSHDRSSRKTNRW